MSGRGSYQMIYQEKTLSHLPTSCTVYHEFLDFVSVNHAGWALVMRLLVSHFWSLNHIPVSKPRKTPGSPIWTLRISALWSVMGYLSGAGSHVYVASFQENSVTQYHDIIKAKKKKAITLYPLSYRMSINCFHSFLFSLALAFLIWEERGGRIP